MKKLTPYQVVELTQPSQSAKPKRKRSNGLACYTPMGDAQASLRVTGTRLDPDGTDMEGAAVYFATGLLQALNGQQGEVRSLIGPSRYSDRVLGIYCNLLVKSAFGPPQDMVSYGSISPALVPYLLGGITTKAAEELCYRALDVMDFFPDKPKTLTLQKAMSNVGFGPGIRHEDTLRERPIAKYNHLSQRQDFLLNLPRGVSYARQLMKDGAYGDSLHRRLLSWKDKVIEEAERLLHPEAGEMTELAAQGRQPVTLTDTNYERAVRRVFEKEWKDLILSGTQEDAVADGEVLMARQIIQRLSYNDRMSAEALVGISLLTGVSVANWTSFAVEDLHRRGETFITAEEVRRAMYMLDASPHYRCERELSGDALVLERGSDNEKLARRLQSPAWPLWSTRDQERSVFYIVRRDTEGTPQYKHKPFSLSSDK